MNLVTTDQKMKFVRSYLIFRPNELDWWKEVCLNKATGAAEAYFADFTISHEQFRELQGEIQNIRKEIKQ